MTKSKTSTIAIVVLSVLLAAALAATIVLAAFTATRSAVTTIQFAGGLEMKVAYENGQYTASDNTISYSPANSGSLTGTTEIEDNLGIAVSAASTVTCTIGVKINNVAATLTNGVAQDAKVKVTFTFGSDWTGDAATKTATFAAATTEYASISAYHSEMSVLVEKITIEGVTSDNDLAGQNIEITFTFNGTTA